MRSVTTALSALEIATLLSLAPGCGAPPAKDPTSAKAVESGLKTPGKCSEAGYCWENPVPESGMFLGAWASGPKDVYVAGAEERIQHFDGSVWTIENEGEGWIDAVWGSGPDDVFAVGDAGLIRHRKGGKWQKEDVEDTNDFEAVWGSGPKDVFAVGDKGTVFHYDGASWSGQTTRSEARLEAVWGSAPSDVYAVGELDGVAGVVLHYDGREWDQTAKLGRRVSRVWGNGKGAVWLAGEDDKGKVTVWKISGGPSQWTPVPVPKTDFVIGLSGVSDNPVLLLHDDTSTGRMMGYMFGRVYALEWNGKGWNRRDLVTVSSPIGMPPWGLTSDGQGSLIAAGWWGIAGTFRPGTPISDGQPELRLTTGNPVLGRNLYGVWGNSASDVIAVGSAGAMLHYDGHAWTPDPAGKTYDFNALHGAKGTLVAVARGGVMLVRKGSVWTEVQTGTSADLYGVWTDGDQIFAGGAAGTMIRCDAKACAAMETGTKKDLWEITGPSASELLADGVDKAVLRWDGVSWKMMVGPKDGFSTIGPDGRGGIMGTTFDTTYRLEQGSWVRAASTGHGEAGGYWSLADLGEGRVLGVYGGGAAPSGARIWNGSKWTEEPLPVGTTLGVGRISSAWAAEGHVFLVGSGGAILHKKPK